MSGRAPRRRPVDPHTGRLYRIVATPKPLRQPPTALRRARLDNLALVPASLLPFKREWQALANALPEGDVLLVLPSTDGLSRMTLQTLAASLRARGRRVRTITADRLHRRAAKNPTAISNDIVEPSSSNPC